MEDPNKTENRKTILTNEEIELIQKAKQGNEKALATLIKNNQGYIISFIRKQYSTLVKDNEFLLEDLIQEGNIGIITALHKFDETKGFKFITYASHWIELSIKNAVKEFSNYYNNTFDENDLQSSKDEETSFDNFDNEDVLTENEALFDNGNDNSKNEIQSDEIDSLLLPILDEREIKILKMYFGINVSTKSLNEIGDILNLSSERVRQLKDRALKRVKKRDKGFYDKYISGKDKID